MRWSHSSACRIPNSAASQPCPQTLKSAWSSAESESRLHARTPARPLLVPNWTPASAIDNDDSCPCRRCFEKHSAKLVVWSRIRLVRRGASCPLSIRRRTIYFASRIIPAVCEAAWRRHAVDIPSTECCEVPPLASQPTRRGRAMLLGCPWTFPLSLSFFLFIFVLFFLPFFFFSFFSSLIYIAS